MMYFHGGGFMVGRSEDTEFLTRKMCVQNNLVVVSVNYRLAPEWPFPTGLDDCVAAYRWVLEQGDTLGADTGRIVFAGDSSGSNFAATAALRARDAGLPLPTAVVMLGPVCDFNFERYDSFNRLAPKGIVYDAAFAGFMRGGYVRYEDWSHPHVSPIYADLGGFPPTILVVGTADPIVDSARAFARKLQEAGNQSVELFVSERMPHGFYFFPRLFREEVEAYDAVEKFLQKHLRG
jgi:acetyl esterase